MKLQHCVNFVTVNNDGWQPRLGCVDPQERVNVEGPAE